MGQQEVRDLAELRAACGKKRKSVRTTLPSFLILDVWLSLSQAPHCLYWVITQLNKRQNKDCCLDENLGRYETYTLSKVNARQKTNSYECDWQWYILIIHFKLVSLKKKIKGFERHNFRPSQRLEGSLTKCKFYQLSQLRRFGFPPEAAGLTHQYSPSCLWCQEAAHGNVEFWA